MLHALSGHAIHHRAQLVLGRVAILAVALAAIPSAHADEPPLAAKPPSYALAWQLRPAVVGNVVRSDTSVATYNDDGLTVASTLLVSYKLTPRLAPLVRIAVVRDTPPMGESAVSMVNSLLGVNWAPAKIKPPLKLVVMGAFTVPVGSGGGNTPDMQRAAANRSGVIARSSMDNALFAVNDTALIGGLDLAYVDRGFTAQAEVTLFELIRVRGADVQPDATKTNLTAGIHAGYFLVPQLSVGAELRYQRYLSTPAFVKADMTGANRDTLSVAAGVRGHFKLSGGRWVRPGLAYGRGLDDPMNGRGYNVVQIDVPIAF